MILRLPFKGRTVEDAGRVMYQVGIEEAKVIPYYARSIMGYLWFSPLFTERVKKRGIRSQQRRYAGDFVLNYVEGDGAGF